MPLKRHRSGCLVSADFAMLHTLRKLEERKRPGDEFNLLRNHVMSFSSCQFLSASKDGWYGEKGLTKSHNGTIMALGSNQTAFLYWTPPHFSSDTLVLTGYLRVQLDTNSSVLFQCLASLTENILPPPPQPPFPPPFPTDSLVSVILRLEKNHGYF